jgi:hypothetical protein
MTIIIDAIKALPNDEIDNGNANFWESLPHAERIGGTVVETHSGLMILNGWFYDYENLSLVNVDVLIEKVIDSDHGSYFTITSYLGDTDTEYHVDEDSESLTEAFESLSEHAPAPSYLEAWNSSHFAKNGAIAEEYGNVLDIENFPWRSNAYPDEVISSRLAIYVHRNSDVRDEHGHYFTIYAGATGFASGDVNFSTFEELLEAAVSFRK